eukprot:843024_1
MRLFDLFKRYRSPGVNKTGSSFAFRIMVKQAGNVFYGYNANKRVYDCPNTGTDEAQHCSEFRDEVYQKFRQWQKDPEATDSLVDTTLDPVEVPAHILALSYISTKETLMLDGVVICSLDQAGNPQTGEHGGVDASIPCEGGGHAIQVDSCKKWGKKRWQLKPTGRNAKAIGSVKITDDPVAIKRQHEILCKKRKN